MLFPVVFELTVLLILLLTYSSHWRHTWILHELTGGLTDFRLNSLLWLLCIVLHSTWKSGCAPPLKASPLLSQLWEDCSSGRKIKTLQWMLGTQSCKSGFCSYHTATNWWGVLSFRVSLLLLEEGAVTTWCCCSSWQENTGGIAGDLHLKLRVIARFGEGIAVSITGSVQGRAADDQFEIPGWNSSWLSVGLCGRKVWIQGASISAVDAVFLSET